MITIGADPELFVEKHGRFVCAHGLIPGDKTTPFKVPNGAVQVDGMALEFNIDPVSSFAEFDLKLKSVMGKLKEMVSGFEFLKSVTVEINPEDFSEELLAIGCNPDINAYTQDFNPSPDPSTRLRSAGGHIHIGGIYKEDQTEASRFNEGLRLVRLLDKYLGVYSLLWDKDDTRRKIYGLAGSCRLKSYGIEYRTLSNQWIFDDQISKFVFNQANRAVLAFKAGEDVTSEFYREIIDTPIRDHEFFSKDYLANVLKIILKKR
jgi:hypothetical protein